MKKERWTESEVLSLPSGEQDYFERKSGALIRDSDFHEKIAKAISAFANSGGGHLIIGVRDDGSIDGVPRNHKGRRTSTKDWLEQVIPNLVSYPLQDFRVHEVEPEIPSIIPANAVIIVIDVGDSLMAPHQSASSKIYFHRTGGRSQPAPHHFLEALRGREKYPSQKIAHSWLNFVIAPLLARLRMEEDKLVTPRQPWVGHHSSLEPGSYFQPLGKNLSANYIQFLKFYPDIQREIDQHDKAIISVHEAAERLVDEIATSHFMSDAYERFQTSEYLQRIRELYQQRVADRNEKLRDNLFGDRTAEETRKALAKFIAYDYPQTDEAHYLWPLWQTFKPDLMQFLQYSPIREQNERSIRARDEFLKKVRSLITILEAIRHDLAFQHQEPYEDSTLSSHWPQPSTLF